MNIINNQHYSIISNVSNDEFTLNPVSTPIYYPRKSKSTVSKALIDSNNGESNNNVDFTDTNNGFDNLTEIESKKEKKKDMEIMKIVIMKGLSNTISDERCDRY